MAAVYGTQTRQHPRPKGGTVPETVPLEKIRAGEKLRAVDERLSLAEHLGAVNRHADVDACLLHVVV